MNRHTASTIPWVGVDVLDRRELDRLLKRPWFLNFAYAPQEVEEADTMGPQRRSEFLAGRFAAKEAVLKALGRGLLQDLAPSDIRVVREESGAPHVAFLGEATLRPLPPVSLSIAHKENVVVAVALCPRWSEERTHARPGRKQARRANPKNETEKVGPHVHGH